MRAYAEIGKRTRHGLVAQGVKNAADGVHIGGGWSKIIPKAARKHKLGVRSVREMESLRGKSVTFSIETKQGVR